VVLRLRSKQKDLSLDTYGASYREPGGRQINAKQALGPTELGADSNARVAVIFKKAKVGGVVPLEVSDSDLVRTAAAKIRIG
jgi:hypothetical protein